MFPPSGRGRGRTRQAWGGVKSSIVSVRPDSISVWHREGQGAQSCPPPDHSSPLSPEAMRSDYGSPVLAAAAAENQVMGVVSMFVHARACVRVCVFSCCQYCIRSSARDIGINSDTRCQSPSPSPPGQLITVKSEATAPYHEIPESRVLVWMFVGAIRRVHACTAHPARALQGVAPPTRIVCPVRRIGRTSASSQPLTPLLPDRMLMLTIAGACAWLQQTPEKW